MHIKQAQVINETDFDVQVLHSTQAVLVGFLAGWSKPCLLLEPILDEVAQSSNGQAKIFKANVDDNPDLGTIYAIQAVPTLVYFFNGQVRAKIVGMASAKAILARLHSLAAGNIPANDSQPPRG